MADAEPGAERPPEPSPPPQRAEPPAEPAPLATPGTPRVAQLVVIGASAGGVEAVSRVLATLPPEFPVPIVVAQHLDPSRVSHLREIFARTSPLPVRTVTDREPLAPGQVYVVPADRHVEITDHAVEVHADGSGAPGRPKPSIDLLFSSAARAFGEHLYAVILSGTGSDGADGARLVKEVGGTVIIQNPQTAHFPGMPLSLAPTTVDIVAELETIGPLLNDLLSGVYVPPSADEDRRIRALLSELRTRSGIDFSQYRQPTIQRRLQRRMADTGTASLEEYVRYLRRHPEEYQRLANSFLIKVTDFFRDPDLFTYLRERVLPELIAEAEHAERYDPPLAPRTDERAAAGRSRQLRIWSAGCATGEEAYSLAILVAEALGDDLLDFDVRIFATDVDGEAIAFGRRGVYPVSALQNLSPAQINRFFTPVDDAYEVKRFVRKLVVFGQHDLGQRAPFPHIDLALCRNVLIYFTPELQRRALQLFAFALRTGGRLVLGKSETTNPLPEFFALDQQRLKIFRRVGERVLVLPSRIRDDAAPPPAPPARAALAPIDPSVTRALQARRPAESTGERAERLLLDLPVGVVVIDRRFDVQAINSAARQLLNIRSPALGEDFVHLARQLPSDRLRDAVERALRGQMSVERFEVTLLGALGDETRVLELGFYPQPAKAAAGRTERVSIVASDVTSTAQEQPRRETEYDRGRADIERLAGRVQALADQAPASAEAAGVLRMAREGLAAAQSEIERLTRQALALDQSRRELLAANDELAAANAELRSLNEDLMLGSEEAQAAVEEIETLAEEQQASNEELETLNEELQSTVEELNTTNDDLEARGLELQATATALEGQRARLSAVLSSMADAVLVVDRNGRPVLTNAAFDRVFGSAGAAFVPYDEEGRRLPPEATPQRRAARGETFSLQFRWGDGEGGGPRWFEATGQPIRDAGQEGGVIVIRDVSERSLLRLQEQFVAIVGHELRTPLASLTGFLQLLTRAPAQRRRQPGAEGAPRPGGASGANGAGSVGDDQARRLAEMALQQARRLNDLIGDLLDVTRLRRGAMRFRFARVDLVPLLGRVAAAAQALTTDQTIRLDTGGSGEGRGQGQVFVHADARRLEQALMNLLSNAVSHAPGTDVVDLRLQRVAGDPAAGRAAVAEITVQDYGPGIPAADLPRVFSSFFQAEGTQPGSSGEDQGLGLGLYIAREIVRAHDGTIDVRSIEGEGATFIVRLPLHEGDSSDAEAETADGRQPTAD